VLVSWTVHEIAGAALSIPCAFIATYENEIQQMFFSFHPRMATWSFITRLVFFVLTAVLIGQFRNMVSRIRQMAMVDDLTGAYNVRAFFDILHKELRRSRRSGQALTVVYLDLDNFKIVNDSHGHQAGNAVLKTVARAMLEAVRQTDSVGRMGGDEFAILLPETGEAEARVTLPRIQSEILSALHNGNWPVTVSIGVLICEHTTCTTDEIFRRADSLMYQVKNAGKNGIRYDIAGASEPVAEHFAG
jgi:diguanylate cyclase (GGDEF)-like protein